MENKVMNFVAEFRDVAENKFEVTAICKTADILDQHFVRAQLLDNLVKI